MKNQETKKKFNLFDMNRDGKGVDPGEDTTPNLAFFFKQFGRKFSKILSLNILMIFQVAPILIAVYLFFAVAPTTPTMYSPEYAALFGIQENMSSVSSMLDLGHFSMQFGIPTYNTYIYWVIGVLLAVLVITFGWQMVGSTYVLRGLVRGDSVFILSDFFYAIKKNFKQGFLMGLIDCLIIFVLGFDIYFFYTSEPNAMTNFMYAMVFALIVIYIIFRFYIYLMLVTFDMKISKIFKNALIFVVVGIKRNIMALIGLLLITALAIVPILLFLPLGLGVALVLPFIYYLGTCGFISTYAAYPIIKTYMIDPVYSDFSDESENDDTDACDNLLEE